MDPLLLAVRNAPKRKPTRPAARRPPPPPKPKPKPRARPRVPLTLEQTQLAEATRLAAAAINPAKADIAKAVAAAEDRRLMQARATEGITRALGELTAGDSEASRAAYADAAARLGQYGGFLTGQLRDTQQASAAAASAGIAGLGLPGAVTSGADANANVAGMQGVVIPGEGLAAQGARARDAAAMARLAGGLRVADNASLADFKAQGDIASIRGEVEKLEAKRPGLIMEALSDIRQQANAKRATDTQIGYLQLQQAKTVQDQAVAMTNMTGSLHIVVGKGKNARVVNTGKPALGSDAAVSQVKAATSRANAQLAAATKTKTARIAAEQREDAAKIAANAKISAAKIAAQKKTVTTAKSGVDAQTKFVTEGRKYARQIAGVNEKTGKPRSMPPKRTAIMNALVNTYGKALVGRYGITLADVQQWAHAIVMAMPNAWWQPSSYKAATSGGSSGTGGSYTAGG